MGLAGWIGAPPAPAGIDRRLSRRRLLRGDHPAAAGLRRRPGAVQGGRRGAVRGLRGRHPGRVAAGRLHGGAGRPAAHAHLRAPAARPGEPGVRLRAARGAARRRALRPGGGRGPCLGRGPDLADPCHSGGAARLRDRRRPRHRDRGSVAGACPRSAGGEGGHRARLRVGAGLDRGAGASGAAHLRAGPRRAAWPARGGTCDHQALGASRDLVRGGALRCSA